MSGVTVRRGTTLLLDGVHWQVDDGERWCVLGPNGAGKSTLLSVLSGVLFPTVGQVEILGERLGRCDVAELRLRIGTVTSAAGHLIPPTESVENAVITGAWAVSGRWNEGYTSVDVARAHALLEQVGAAHLMGRTIGTLSDGERKRVLLARSLMADPELLLLDEPAAALDVGSREDLITRLSGLARAADAPALILVTHHVEEIPTGFTHVLLLRRGRVVARGPLATTLTSDALTATFGLPLEVESRAGRWLARATGPAS
jgi:iron complex transport system ATP-binding protein